MKRFLFFFTLIIVVTWIWLRQTISSEHHRTMNRPNDKIVVRKDNFKKKDSAKLLRRKPENLQIEQKVSAKLEKSLEEFEEQNFEPYNNQGDVYITKVFIDQELAIAHGDLIIGTGQDVLQAQQIGHALKLRKSRAWPNNKIPYMISPQIGPDQANLIRKVLNDFSRLTNVEFVNFTNQDDFIVFQPTPDNCYSFVGHIGGKQDIYLSPKCGQREINHEVLHALGLMHEHSRPDRDQHVVVYWENIREEFHPQFKKLPWKDFDLDRFPYDMNSIMNYPGNAFAIDNQSSTITSITGEPFIIPETLSLFDIEKVNYLYPNEIDE